MRNFLLIAVSSSMTQGALATGSGSSPEPGSTESGFAKRTGTIMQGRSRSTWR